MRIQHGRVTLELHQLAHRAGPTLLLMHGLGGCSEDWGEAPAAWAGAVYALDFSGHGRSEWVPGGAYYPELLAADADAALAQIGPATLAGAGVGAYVALLLAGARRQLVPAALLLPGPGLDGGGALPDFHSEYRPFAIASPVEAAAGGYDPMARALEADVRPADYAASFAQAARRLLLVEDGGPRPPWWEAARRGPSAESAPAALDRALTRLAEIVASAEREG